MSGNNYQRYCYLSKQMDNVFTLRYGNECTVSLSTGTRGFIIMDYGDGDYLVCFPELLQHGIEYVVCHRDELLFSSLYVGDKS